MRFQGQFDPEDQGQGHQFLKSTQTTKEPK